MSDNTAVYYRPVPRGDVNGKETKVKVRPYASILSGENTAKTTQAKAADMLKNVV